MWLEIWLSIKRFHKDRRARKHLVLVGLGIGLLLAIVAGAIAYLFMLVGTGAIFILPLVLPALWWIRRSTNREYAPLSISPQTERVDAKTEEEREGALRSYFADLALLYAVLLDRAESERFLKEKELPEGVEITARRMHLDLLKSTDLWTRISATDRNVIMMPDGHWDANRINQITTGFEPLRLLRWILRLDFRLPTIGQHLYGDFSIAHELVMNPQKVLRAHRLVDAEAVRFSRDQARTTFLRCIAEAISRGYHVPEDKTTIDWAHDLAKSLAGNQHEDILLGDNLVSEAAQNQLTWATALAKIRHEFLSRVLTILEDGQPPRAPLATIFDEQWTEETEELSEQEQAG